MLRISRSPIWSSLLWRILLGAALPSALLFSVAAGCYLLFTRVLSDNGPVQADGSYKDVLQTVLAIAAIAIGAVGVGTYRLLSQQISEKVARDSEKRLRIANAIHKVDLGLIFWNFAASLAGLATEDRLAYIDEAIRVTREAYKDELDTMDLSDPEVKRLVIQVRNNWAYYIYEKDRLSEPEGVDESEKQTALMFVDFIQERKVDYSALIDDLDDTINAVTNRFRPGRG